MSLCDRAAPDEAARWIYGLSADIAAERSAVVPETGHEARSFERYFTDVDGTLYDANGRMKSPGKSGCVLFSGPSAPARQKRKRFCSKGFMLGGHIPLVVVVIKKPVESENARIGSPFHGSTGLMSRPCFRVRTR